jgi:hypothetical protein
LFVKKEETLAGKKKNGRRRRRNESGGSESPDRILDLAFPSSRSNFPIEVDELIMGASFI